MGYHAAMRRHLTAVVLLTLQALVAALSALFHVRARVAVLEAFRAYDTAVPLPTQVALSSWLLPAALGVALLLDAAALALPLGRSRRTALLAAALVVPSTALMFAVWAAFMPIFRPE
jgi:hypothetical protein